MHHYQRGQTLAPFHKLDYL